MCSTFPTEMDAHGPAVTLALSTSAGVFLVALAERLRVPSIALLLFGGILLGPQVLGWIDPTTLGEGLEVVVTLAVAVILFEGGLTLDIAGFRREPTVIVRMLTLGVLVTWAGTAAAVYFVYPDMGLELALIAGSLVIVTGPTVVSPLLRRIGVQPRLHHILYWEGVLVDAIGVFIAVLCYEWIASTSDQPLLAPIGRFASRFAIGAGIGSMVGLALGFMIRRRLVSSEHTNIFVLAGAMLALGISNAVLAESGILAVITAGLVLGFRQTPQLKELRRFKLELTEIGIGLLFVLLAAKLDLSMFITDGGRLITVLLLTLVVLRPINVLLSTWGLHFSWRERAFLSWLAPRGIVAASMASLFSLRLEKLGYEQAGFLETLTYAVIGTTVIVQGLSAPLVARLLGLQRKSRATWLLIGDPALTVILHRQLRQAGARSLIIADSNSEETELTEGRIENLGSNPFEPRAFRDPRVADVEAVLALSTDPTQNDRICEAWSSVVGPAACYRWDSESRTHGTNIGHRIWTDVPSPASMKAAISNGSLALDAVEVGSQVDSRRFGETLRPILSIDDGHINLVDADLPPQAAMVLVVRRRIADLYGLVQDALILDKPRATFDEVVRALLELAAKTTPELPVEQHRTQILTREQTMPTTVGAGIAIPHVYEDRCLRSKCYVANVLGGLNVIGPDEIPVQLVFLVVSPQGKPQEHLRSLAAVAHLASDRELTAVLAQQRTRGRLLSLLRERE